MSQTQVKTARNQSVECARLMAAVFVVFIHCNFPGNFGVAVNCIARFAVPFFFIISGYYSFQAGREKLGARLRYLFWLNIWASLLYVLHRFAVAALEGQTLAGCFLAAAPSLRQLVEWVILSENPFCNHLWYLAAIWGCTLILWAYTALSEEGCIRYQPLYIVCACLLAVQLLLGEMAGLAGVEIPELLCRNVLVLGLPMFGLGLFLREYRERILSAFALTDGKLLLLILGGVCFSLVRRFKVGHTEVPVGMVAAAAALMLLAAGHPRLPVGGKRADACISRFGPVSMLVYILHRLVMDDYLMFCAPWLGRSSAIWSLFCTL